MPRLASVAGAVGHALAVRTEDDPAVEDLVVGLARRLRDLDHADRLPLGRQGDIGQPAAAGAERGASYSGIGRLLAPLTTSSQRPPAEAA